MNVRPNSSDAPQAIQTVDRATGDRSEFMKRRSYRAAAALLLAAALVTTYCWRLSDAPIYLSHDEVIFALNARHIAFTGRDVLGDFLPLYVHVTGNYWLTAAVMYLGVVFQRTMALTEMSARLPAVTLGVIDVLLMYGAAHRIFGRRDLGLIAAALLAMTPAHFIHSRLGVDHLCPVAFEIAWLWCLAVFFRTRRARWLIAACVALGVGAYTYLAATIVMPVFLLLTGAIVLWTLPEERRSMTMAAAAFGLTLLPLGLWLAVHPSQFSDHVRMYSLYAPSLSPLQGMKDLASYTSLTARTDIYWDYFNPSFLFFAGDSSLINSTRQAGVFLLAYAVLLPVGLWRLRMGTGVEPMTLVVVLALLLSPVAAVVVGEPHRINRALVMLPPAALIATAGIGTLTAASSRWPRALAVALLVAAPLQFLWFYRDYQGDYRVRSSEWFERNIRGAVKDVLARDRARPATAIYLSKSVQWVEEYWRFYSISSGTNAPRATTVFDPKTLDAASVPAGALLLIDAAAPPQPMPPFRPIARIAEPNGSISFILMER
jgi:4-amino-4-deoxy-L-arabinose transferase-like glycosyltransferase